MAASADWGVTIGAEQCGRITWIASALRASQFRFFFEVVTVAGLCNFHFSGGAGRIKSPLRGRVLFNFGIMQKKRARGYCGEDSIGRTVAGVKILFPALKCANISESIC